MKAKTNIYDHNEKAWDKKVDENWKWTQPVSSEEIEMARTGEVKIGLTCGKLMPRQWLPDKLDNVKILCLASGGGQQGPLLAAAGAEVTVLDLSNKQLEQDKMVARREGLTIDTVKGNMCDLSMFDDEIFDIVFCPVSATYIENLEPLFRESQRVLKVNGIFLFGTPNPFIYLFDDKKWEQGIFEVANTLPFNSLDGLSEDEKEIFISEKRPIEYSHTLNELIGKQVEIGFAIVGFYEDCSSEEISRYTATYFATKALKV